MRPCNMIAIVLVVRPFIKHFSSALECEMLASLEAEVTEWGQTSFHVAAEILNVITAETWSESLCDVVVMGSLNGP